MSLLVKLLNLEKELWQPFGATNTTLDGYEVQYTKNIKNLPFMNIAIPLNNPKLIYNKKDLEKLDDFFCKNGSEGYLPHKRTSSSVRLLEEEDEYFYLRNTNDQILINNEGFKVIETTDYKQFSRVVKEGFNYGLDFIDSFALRMKLAGKALDTKFYLLLSGNKILGCISYFRKSINGPYCLMNASILKNHRNKGLGNYLILRTTESLQSDVYARTTNISMKKVFRRLNFLSGGTFSLISIKSFLKKGLHDEI